MIYLSIVIVSLRYIFIIYYDNTLKIYIGIHLYRCVIAKPDVHWITAKQYQNVDTQRIPMYTRLNV